MIVKLINDIRIAKINKFIVHKPHIKTPKIYDENNLKYFIFWNNTKKEINNLLYREKHCMLFVLSLCSPGP